MVSGSLKVAELIKQALEKNGLLTLKHASKSLGISQQLLSIMFSRGHIPMDATLCKIADDLGMDKAALILAAHREKVPAEVKGYFFIRPERKTWSERTVNGSLKVAGLIKQALEQKGLRSLKHAADALGISQQLLRIMVNREHIPKDATLGQIADKLGMDKAALILAAHREKVPAEVKEYFLFCPERKTWQKKRVWPLSEEQCYYLGKIMKEEEIQLIRKLRQVSDEARAQIGEYVDYTWASKRMMNAGDDKE
jgi:transcriptional regulator with XRE-family HTH domain